MKLVGDLKSADPQKYAGPYHEESECWQTHSSFAVRQQWLLHSTIRIQSTRQASFNHTITLWLLRMTVNSFFRSSLSIMSTFHPVMAASKLATGIKRVDIAESYHIRSDSTHVLLITQLATSSETAIDYAINQMQSYPSKSCQYENEPMCILITLNIYNSLPYLS
jgi:hypothetical protein